MAAIASMASVGETPSQPEALPLQGAAAGLGMSHQPAAPLSYTGDAPAECVGLSSLEGRLLRILNEASVHAYRRSKWKDGREANCAGLLNQRGTPHEGSNPSPSANSPITPWVSQLPPDSEKSVEELADSDNHPGETIEPTPSPVQAATVRAAAQGGSLTEAEMVAVLTEAGWPAELHSQALAVSWCESRWSPYAVGDGGRSLGLFQMQWSGAGWRGWFIPAGEDEAMAHDPVTNARVALWAYQRSGWGPWSCAR